MQLQPDRIYHIYNRGNNQQPIFFTEANYLYFLRKLRHYLLPHVRVLAWCLMPNHFHLLVQVRGAVKQDECSKAFRICLSSYSRAIQVQQQTTGSLFQQNTQARLVDEAAGLYPLNCFCYVHQNPWRAGLESEPGGWPWSSWPDYLGRRGGTLCDQAAARQLLDLPDSVSELEWLMRQRVPDEVAQRLS